MRNSDGGRSVAQRVLAVLEVFENHGPLLSLSQIAEFSELPVSTAHRIVNELHDWGALARDSKGRYQIGMRLWEISQNASRRLRDSSRPFLQDLYSLTGQSAHIVVREGNEVLYVDRVYGSRRVPRASRIGGRLSLHATAVGKVLLAYEEPWFREAYLSQDLKGMTPKTRVDATTLSEELKEIADRGYAITNGEARLGACSIAVPVGLGHGAAPNSTEAAIGLVALAEDFSKLTDYLPALRGVAKRIEVSFFRRPKS